MTHPQQASHQYHRHHHHHIHHGSDDNVRLSLQQQRTVDTRIPAIEKQARCLFCLHVKPATIFISIWKLIRALQFAILLLSAELSTHQHSDVIKPPNDDNRSTFTAFCILLRVMVASASAVAIYAVCSGKAALLMPLYSMVLVDFFLGLPAFYNKDVDPTYADGLSDFGNDHFPTNDHQHIHKFFMISVAILISKMYILSIIWRCFRYMRLMELLASMRSARPYSHMPTHRTLDILDHDHQLTPQDLSSSPAPPPYESIEANTKPPTYEDAIKSSSIFTIDMQHHQRQQPPCDPADQLPDYAASVQSTSINQIV